MLSITGPSLQSDQNQKPPALIAKQTELKLVCRTEYCHNCLTTKHKCEDCNRFIPCGPEDYNKRYSLIAVDKENKQRADFKEILCASGNPDYSHLKFQCQPIFLEDGSFLIIDCFGSDAIDNKCEVLKFLANGTPDPSFNCDFSSPNEIFDLAEVTVLPNRRFALNGRFRSKKVDGLSDQERRKCGGQDKEECVGFTGKMTSAQVIMDYQGKIVEKTLLGK